MGGLIIAIVCGYQLFIGVGLTCFGFLYNYTVISLLCLGARAPSPARVAGEGARVPRLAAKLRKVMGKTMVFLVFFVFFTLIMPVKSGKKFK